jgi:hypothetical protein
MSEKKIALFGRKGMSLSEAAAATVTHGVPVASLVKEVVGSDHLDLLDMTAEFERSGAKVVAGDLSDLERALTRQFMTLDALFGELGVRGIRSKDIRAKEALMKLALRAQSQARATAETLGVLKNPPLVIARQANITTGPQQINNGVTTTSPTRAREKKNAPNELLKDAQHVDSMDTRAPRTAGAGHSGLATLEVEHWPENRRRKKPLQDE